MKYLKISDRKASAELIDLLDLQIELLRNGLEFDLIRQYTKIVGSFRKKTFSLLELASTDYDKLRRIMSNTTEEYKKFYVENNEDFFESGMPVLYLNPLNKRIIRFYFSGLEHAFKESHDEKFNYFYNELLLFLRKLTNSSLNKQKVVSKDFFTGEDSIKWEARLIQMFREIMFELSKLITKQISNNELDSDQVMYCARLYWQLYFELILDPEFEPLMIDESINFWEQLLTTFISSNLKVNETFLLIARELHVYSDHLIRQKQELNEDSFADYRTLVDKCNRIISRRDFIAFEKDLIETFIDTSTPQYIALLRVGELGIKVSLLRMALLRVYANASFKGKTQLVVEMLFARQPVNSNFINSNNDFFPTEVGFIRQFLIVYKNQRHFGLNPLRYENLENEIDKVVFIWLYRNAYWFIRRNENISSFNLGEFQDGYEVSQILNTLRTQLKVADSFDTDLLPTIIINQEDGISIEKFKTLLSDEINRISQSNQDRILDAELDSEKKSSFLEKVKIGINQYSGLFNLFKPIELSDSAENDIIVENIETFDKTAFIAAGIAANISINAHEVYPSLCVQNFALKRDVLLARELKRYCNSHTLTITEMENYFLKNSFEGKLIITHYLHVGYEILKDRINYKDYSFKNLEGKTFQIHQISSFNYLKFVFILDVSRINNFIQSNDPSINLELLVNNRMNAEAKMTSRFRINELDGLIGDFFSLR